MKTIVISFILLSINSFAGNLSTLINAGGGSAGSAEIAANSLYFSEGGASAYCKAKSSTSTGLGYTFNIGSGLTCSSGKTCSDGSCVASSTQTCDAVSTAVGTTCTGGAKYAGVYGGFRYMTTPGGCTDSTTPTCAGGTDSTTKAWANNTGNTANGKTVGASSTDDGLLNTTLVASGFYSDVDAVKFCSDMVYGGYSDWFLPAYNEITFLYSNKASLGGFVANWYWSSRENDASNASLVSLVNGTYTNNSKTTLYPVRCVRKF